MVYSSLAERILGPMDIMDIIELEPRRIYSKKDVYPGSPGLAIRHPQRYLFPGDLDKQREEVLKQIPDCLK